MYLLDANVFIQAKKEHYGFAFCPAFWSWLDDAHSRSLVFSIEKVYDELMDQADELSAWASTRSSMFLKWDGRISPSFQNLTKWTEARVQSNIYTRAAANAFFQDADYYLVAQADAYQYTVVTHERPNLPNRSPHNIKIPEACDGMPTPVKWLSPFRMLEVEQALFVLGP